MFHCWEHNRYSIHLNCSEVVTKTTEADISKRSQNQNICMYKLRKWAKIHTFIMGEPLVEKNIYSKASLKWTVTWPVTHKKNAPAHWQKQSLNRHWALPWNKAVHFSRSHCLNKSSTFSVAGSWFCFMAGCRPQPPGSTHFSANSLRCILVSQPTATIHTHICFHHLWGLYIESNFLGTYPNLNHHHYLPNSDFNPSNHWRIQWFTCWIQLLVRTV